MPDVRQFDDGNIYRNTNFSVKHRSFPVQAFPFNQSVHQINSAFLAVFSLTFSRPRQRQCPRPHHRVHAGAGAGGGLVFPLPGAGGCGSSENPMGADFTRWGWDESKVKTYEFSMWLHWLAWQMMFEFEASIRLDSQTPIGLGFCREMTRGTGTIWHGDHPPAKLWQWWLPFLCLGGQLDLSDSECLRTCSSS